MSARESRVEKCYIFFTFPFSNCIFQESPFKPTESDTTASPEQIEILLKNLSYHGNMMDFCLTDDIATVTPPFSRVREFDSKIQKLAEIVPPVIIKAYAYVGRTLINVLVPTQWFEATHVNV